MTRHRTLTALVALIPVGVMAAVIYRETSSSGSAAPTTTTITTITSTTMTSTTTTTTTTTTMTTTTSTTTTTRTTLRSATVATTTVVPTTEAPTTLLATTLLATTLLPTTVPPPERSLVPVVVSSGPSNGERVAPGAFLMGSVGWTDIRPLNGSMALTRSTVFYVDGFQAAAELLAVDAGIPITSIAPMADAPPVAGLANAQLLCHLGGA